jgi:hypothetical protein
MALSPNYGWAEPDNSSLVKNGAQDIRALGDAIDTSVWNVGYGQAGKNKIINGDFSIWRRGTTFNSYANGAYSADRFFTLYNGTGSTRNLTQQTFTPGTAPVAGYEGQFFARYDQTVAGTTATFNTFGQRIEDVRTFAGQQITVSFYAKASANTTFGVGVQQNFGSGGSTAVTQEFTSAFAVTTSWVRYSQTFTLASIAGKTLGTNNYLSVYATMPLNATFTLDTWGWQVEYGSKATPFQTASGGSPQAELAMCQRYLPAISGDSNTILGFAFNTTGSQISIKFPVTARAKITGITVNGTFASNYNLTNQGFTSGTPTAIAFNNGGTDYSTVNVTTTAGAPTLVAGQPVQLSTLTSNGYILFTGAEL